MQLSNGSMSKHEKKKKNESSGHVYKLMQRKEKDKRMIPVIQHNVS